MFPSMYFTNYVLFCCIFTVAPAIWVPSPIQEGTLGYDVTLNCHIEAFPSSTNHWIKGGSDEPIEPNDKYEIKVDRRSYKTHLQLVIKNLKRTDYGLYKCLAKNALGNQERDIRVLGKHNVKVVSADFALHFSCEFNLTRYQILPTLHLIYKNKYFIMDIQPCFFPCFTN